MKVVICECASNGTFLLDDCRSMGLEPIVIFPESVNDSLVESVRQSSIGAIDDSVTVLHPTSVDEAIDFLSGMDIACVIAGSEYGIHFADQLSKRLGFPGNDPSTTHRRTTKYHMQSSLKEAGLRYIANSRVSSKEDVEDFWNEFQPERVVIKPDVSVGSFGVHICDSLEDSVKAMEDDLAAGSWTGEAIDDVLIQEFIGGEEYIVNTVSRDGIHRITDFWVYTKVEIAGSIVPIGVRTVTTPTVGESDLVTYALNVLDAVGLENGPSHIELKMDGKGPVLIEINARPMGGHFSVPCLDEALGHHVTDMSLKSLVDPDFVTSLPEGVPSMKCMYMVVLVTHESRTVDLAPLNELVKGMGSFRNIYSPLYGKGPTYIEATADYVSSLGSVELVSDNVQSTEEDFAVIIEIQARMPDLMYGSKEPLAPTEPCLIEYPEGRSIVFDRGGVRVHEDGIFTECIEDERFDQCVINPYGSMSLEDVYRGLFEAIERTSIGAKITVSPSLFGMVPYGRKGVFRILMLANLEFDIPEPGEPIVAMRV